MIKKFLLLLLLIAPTQVLFSQGVTTASISGRVIDENRNPLTGATVKATHELTSSVFGAKTSSTGRYNIRGLKTGGPYKITVSLIGFQSQEIDSVYLSIDQDKRMDFTLSEKSRAWQGSKLLFKIEMRSFQVREQVQAKLSLKLKSLHCRQFPEAYMTILVYRL